MLAEVSVVAAATKDEEEDIIVFVADDIVAVTLVVGTVERFMHVLEEDTITGELVE